MSEYRLRAEVNGEEVWSGSADDGGVKNFPEEYRRQPADGDPAVTLLVDDIVIAVQMSQAEAGDAPVEAGSSDPDLSISATGEVSGPASEENGE